MHKSTQIENEILFCVCFKETKLQNSLVGREHADITPMRQSQYRPKPVVPVVVLSCVPQNVSSKNAKFKAQQSI